MTAYYNENDPKAAAWLRELIRRNLIAPGEVDERSIVDIRPEDLRGFTQCHFFAGIGVWSYALRLAGIPDDEPLWTGSCPCQPFSAAGKGDGFADERHLWPAWFHLIGQCRPATILGEQVASKAAEPWIDLVQADVEAVDYAFGCQPFPSAGVGAPHIRDRAYWVAVARSQRFSRLGLRLQPGAARFDHAEASGGGEAHGLADTKHAIGRTERDIYFDAPGRHGSGWCGDSGRLALADGGISGDGVVQRSGKHGLEQEDGGARGAVYAERAGLEGHAGHGDDGHEPGRLGAIAPRSTPAAGDVGDRPGPTNGYWRAADWLACTDGKWRPVEPGTFPLAHGAPARLVRLRGYGNAINAEAARAFIEAVM